MEQDFFTTRAIATKDLYLIPSSSNPFLDQGPAWIFNIDQFFFQPPKSRRLVLLIVLPPQQSLARPD
ncbi:hypothetical protein KSD_04310 [Ktedonobacter sp. SOSP1-85]|nr:hypothetical protein KSD_04310 [Ktedonobacter sp. SOSP1-85]